MLWSSVFNRVRQIKEISVASTINTLRFKDIIEKSAMRKITALKQVQEHRQINQMRQYFDTFECAAEHKNTQKIYESVYQHCKLQMSQTAVPYLRLL